MTIPDRGRGDNTYPDTYISADEPRLSWRRIPRDVLLVALILLIASACFGLGMLAGRQGKGAGKDEGLWIENLVSVGSTSSQLGSVAGALHPSNVKTSAVTNAQNKENSTGTAPSPAVSGGGEVVASKTGTKYYLPWCGTVSRIKEENKVYFVSKAEAEKAGYAPAKNCKGL